MYIIFSTSAANSTVNGATAQQTKKNAKYGNFRCRKKIHWIWRGEWWARQVSYLDIALSAFEILARKYWTIHNHIGRAIKRLAWEAAVAAIKCLDPTASSVLINSMKTSSSFSTGWIATLQIRTTIRIKNWLTSFEWTICWQSNQKWLYSCQLQLTAGSISFRLNLHDCFQLFFIRYHYRSLCRMSCDSIDVGTDGWKLNPPPVEWMNEIDGSDCCRWADRLKYSVHLSNEGTPTIVRTLECGIGNEISCDDAHSEGELWYVGIYQCHEIRYYTRHANTTMAGKSNVIIEFIPSKY